MISQSQWPKPIFWDSSVVAADWVVESLWVFWGGRWSSKIGIGHGYWTSRVIWDPGKERLESHERIIAPGWIVRQRPVWIAYLASKKPTPGEEAGYL